MRIPVSLPELLLPMGLCLGCLGFWGPGPGLHRSLTPHPPGGQGSLFLEATGFPRQGEGLRAQTPVAISPLTSFQVDMQNLLAFLPAMGAYYTQGNPVFSRIVLGNEVCISCNEWAELTGRRRERRCPRRQNSNAKALWWTGT